MEVNTMRYHEVLADILARKLVRKSYPCFVREGDGFRDTGFGGKILKYGMVRLFLHGIFGNSPYYEDNNTRGDHRFQNSSSHPLTSITIQTNERNQPAN